MLGNQKIQQMTFKISPIVAGVLLLSILIILFVLIKGCHNGQNLQTQLTTYQSKIDSIKLQHEADSMVAKENEKNYNISIEYANGILDLRQNQLDATEEKLITTAFALSNLKKKYEHVQADTNNSVTLVDNEFVYDAKSCFESLEFQKKLVSLYIQEVKDVDSAHRSKEKLQENRIKQLGQERDGALLNYNDCMSVANQKLKALQPRRKVLLSIGLIGRNDYLLMGVGGGGFYMDKKDRVFGGNIYGTNQGPMATINIALPLSIKRN